MGKNNQTISDYLSKINAVMLPDLLNRQAADMEAQIKVMFDAYKEGDPETDRDILTKICRHIIPPAWTWEIGFLGLEPQVVIGRFYPMVPEIDKYREESNGRKK